MDRVSGTARRRRGNIQRSGTPWAKISFEMLTISQERSRKP
jgi:hypothetical protein